LFNHKNLRYVINSNKNVDIKFSVNDTFLE